jgi:hypothetical protein
VRSKSTEKEEEPLQMSPLKKRFKSIDDNAAEEPLTKELKLNLGGSSATDEGDCSDD